VRGDDAFFSFRLFPFPLVSEKKLFSTLTEGFLFPVPQPLPFSPPLDACLTFACADTTSSRDEPFFSFRFRGLSYATLFLSPMYLKMETSATHAVAPRFSTPYFSPLALVNNGTPHASLQALSLLHA